MKLQILLTLATLLVGSEDRVIDDAAWRADITETAVTIREHHPRPFREISAEDFDQALEILLRDVPDLTDKEIIVRLAALVALIDDGHTRLSIPRQHPEISLEFGHTATTAPEYEALAFRQLPVAFEKFEDGVFIIAASAEHAELIGQEVTAVDGMPIDDALATVQAITFAENSQLDALMGVDRLTLPEALVALGISESAESVTLDLGNGGRSTLKPLPGSQYDWVTSFSIGSLPLRLENPEEKFWAEHIADGNFVYMQMDEITDGDIPLAEFVENTLAQAEENDAKLVIDIRNNFGGSGGLNKTLVMSLIQSEELNQYNRTFVLTGRRTFSAAQMLVNELEQYTRVSLVGEPTGSRPDHFGDPKKVRLEHSGLTLRVSRLHWSSYGAFDDREASSPDFPAAWTSGDYFSGDDPALELAISLQEISLESLLRNALARKDLHQVGRYTLDSKRSPGTYETDFSDLLLTLGNETLAPGDTDIASFAYQVGLYFYPQHAGLREALEGIGEP